MTNDLTNDLPLGSCFILFSQDEKKLNSSLMSLLTDTSQNRTIFTNIRVWNTIEGNKTITTMCDSLPETEHVVLEKPTVEVLKYTISIFDPNGYNYDFESGLLSMEAKPFQDLQISFQTCRASNFQSLKVRSP